MFLLLVLISMSFVLISPFEYILNYDRLELVDYDKSLVKNALFMFRKYNRTNHALNVTFTLLKDLDGNDMKFTTSLYQLLSNQYKPIGMKLRFNVCEYWKKNIYGTTEHLAQFGNLEGCDIKKGFYYLYNYMPDESKFPQYVPLGSYMVQIAVVWNTNVPIVKIQWHVTAKLKIKRRNRK